MTAPRRGWPLFSVLAAGCIGDVPPLDYGGTTDASTTMSGTTEVLPTTTLPTDPSVTTSSSSSGSSSGSATTSTETGSTGTSSTGGPPTEFGPCSPMPDPLTSSSTKTEHEASNERLSVTLETANNLMLSRLSGPDGADVLYSDTELGERWTGIGYFISFGPPPQDEYSWRGTDAVLTVLEDGPAVVRWSVAWSTDDPSTVAAMVGTTTYTVIPDGRVVREESFDLSHSGAPDGNAWLTAYAGLEAELFDYVQASFDLMCGEMGTPQECTIGDAVKGSDATILGTDATANAGWLCASDSATGHSVTWTSEVGAASGPVTASTRITEVHTAGGDHSVGLQYDWMRNQPPPDGTYGVHVMLFVDDDLDDPCGCSLEQFSAYADPPDLVVVDGAGAILYRSGGGYWELGEVEEVVDLSHASGSALPTSLFFLTGTSGVTGVTLDGDVLTEGTDYLTQAATEPGGAWVYLAHPVQAGQTLQLQTR